MLPGHGGVMDRIDGLVPVSVVAALCDCVGPSRQDRALTPAPSPSSARPVPSGRRRSTSCCAPPTAWRVEALTAQLRCRAARHGGEVGQREARRRRRRGLLRRAQGRARRDRHRGCGRKASAVRRRQAARPRSSFRHRRGGRPAADARRGRARGDARHRQQGDAGLRRRPRHRRRGQIGGGAAAGRQRAQCDLPGVRPRPSRAGHADHRDGQRRAVPPRDGRGDARRDPGAGVQPPGVVDGGEDLGRFGDADEQGARADRGGPSVPRDARPARGHRPPAVGGPQLRRIYRRVDARPARDARHADPDRLLPCVARTDGDAVGAARSRERRVARPSRPPTTTASRRSASPRTH